MKRWMLLIILSLVSMSTAFAQEEVWQITEVQNAAELFDADVRNISLSPDGTMLAGSGNDQICILMLANGDQKCFSTAGTFEVSIASAPNQNPLVWSPDSTRLLFHENLYINFLESDLWTLDVTNGNITNLTDDGALGGILDLEDGTYTLDYLPAYAPNGDIYFFRSERLSDGYSLTLQRLAVDSNEPEEVADLTSILPTLSIYYSPSVSPDGTRIAFPVHAVDPDDERSGLWVVDLTSGEARQLTNVDDLYTGMPEAIEEFRLYNDNPMWAGDAGIVVHAFNPDIMGGVPGSNFLYLDAASGEVTPLVDLSDFSMQLGDAELESQLLRIPREGALSADGSTFVYLAFDVSPTNGRVAAVSLPPDGSEPTIIGDVEFTPIPYVPNSFMSPDGKALLGGWLYSLSAS